MIPSVERSWSGTLDWHALAPYDRFLARRVGDRDEWVIGVGEASGEGLVRFPSRSGTALFGHLAYDLKDGLEGLTSRHAEAEGEEPLSTWWAPRWWVLLRHGRAALFRGSGPVEEGRAFLQRLLAPPDALPSIPPATWTRRTSQAHYLAQVRLLLAHIQRGDIYEVNYCTERTATLDRFDPYAGFARLVAHAQAPFAAFHRTGTRFALCASPERFLRLEGDAVVTQPMKGTRPRSADPAMDQRHAADLAGDPKERSENIMAVDVARHDLSRIAAPRSVEVEELCSVKTYPNVHQLVSTVRARLRAGNDLPEVLRATFPMASMTGAPKRRAMQLIDGVEDMRRGLFSGSLGFVLPDGTADLNVVIRTITYDAATGHASLISGGAITAASDPQQEWEECEVKARSVLNAFGHAC